MQQPIGSRLHGALDYLTGTSLLAVSRLPAVRERFAGRVLLGAGAGHLAYSALTDYELGAVRKLPYKVHLVLDALGALGLVVAGALRDDPAERALLAGIGVYELSAVALSDPNATGAGRSQRHAVTVSRPTEEVRAFLSDPANVRRFSPQDTWPGEYELRAAPGARGTEIHAEAPPADLRRAKQLLEAGEIVTAEGPSGRRGVLSAVMPTLDTGSDAA